jgi:hypothetical protein
MNKLDEIRDELAQQFWKDKWDAIGASSFNVIKHHCNDEFDEYFEAGWNAAMERVKPMIYALEWYKSNMPWDDSIGNVTDPAKEALAKFRGEE